MFSRTVTTTPFGFRLTYRVDGEHFWTEYVSMPYGAAKRDSAESSRDPKILQRACRFLFRRRDAA